MVSIQIGYEDYPLREEFTGYVERVDPDEDLIIHCLDEAYNLRKTDVEKEFKETTLPQVVQWLASQGGLVIVGEVPVVNYEKFVIHPSTLEYAINTLRREYGFKCYLRGKNLFIGSVGTDMQGDVLYDFGKNVHRTNLKYERESSKKYEVEAIGITGKNKEIRATVGSKGGARRTLTFYNVKDEASLKKLAEEELKTLAFDGYSGHITTWGIPYVTHGMVANVKDPEYLDREGRYLIERVRTSYGNDGFSREVYLGRKI